VRGLAYRRYLPSQESDSFDLAWYEWIYYPTWSRLDGLLVGIAIAALHKLRPKWHAAMTVRGNSMLALALVSWFVAWWLFVEPRSLLASVIAFPSIAIVYGMFVVAALSPTCFLSRHRSFVTEWLATLSYALYLTHKICIHLAQHWLAKLGTRADGNLMFICSVAASLLGALVLHLVVERPCLRWRDRLLERRRRREPAIGLPW
jgi:peptidoglycan/LPS O-acetylase OafA/YrhL